MGGNLGCDSVLLLEIPSRIASPGMWLERRSERHYESVTLGRLNISLRRRHRNICWDDKSIILCIIVSSWTEKTSISEISSSVPSCKGLPIRPKDQTRRASVRVSE